MTMFRRLLILTALAALPASAKAADPDPKLNEKAVALLQKRCGECHGPGGRKKAGIDYFPDAAQMIAKKKIVPGNPDESDVIARIEDGSMPEGGPALVGEELKALKNWIAAMKPGAGTP